ncbi:MAG: hypothetical protein JST85_13540 [Acidobacteria bacterium]|nr:hypothetical protein [Acidobacteriota bacterium]
MDHTPPKIYGASKGHKQSDIRGFSGFYFLHPLNFFEIETKSQSFSGNVARPASQFADSGVGDSPHKKCRSDFRIPSGVQEDTPLKKHRLVLFSVSLLV